MKELFQIQMETKATKDQKNNFGGYSYRSCDDILEKAKPVLAKYHCCITLSDCIQAIGARVYVIATATLHNQEGETFSVTAGAREEEVKKGMDAAQITGAASSYARKYALSGLLALDDNKDPDSYVPVQETPASHVEEKPVDKWAGRKYGEQQKKLIASFTETFKNDPNFNDINELLHINSRAEYEVMYTRYKFIAERGTPIWSVFNQLVKLYPNPNKQ